LIKLNVPIRLQQRRLLSGRQIAPQLSGHIINQGFGYTVCVLEIAR